MTTSPVDVRGFSAFLPYAAKAAATHLDVSDARNLLASEAAVVAAGAGLVAPSAYSYSSTLCLPTTPDYSDALFSLI